MKCFQPLNIYDAFHFCMICDGVDASYVGSSHYEKIMFIATNVFSCNLILLDTF